MAPKKNATRVILSIIFIAYGLSSVFTAFDALLDLNIGGILSCTLGLLMFITGIFGLIKTQIKVCRVLGVIICILSALEFALALVGGAFVVQSLVTALLAWLYFDCT